MDAELRLMLNQSISVERFLSRDGAGDVTYDAPVIVPCYLYGEVARIMTLNNIEEISMFKVILDGQGFQPGLKDRITPSYLGIPMPIKLIQPIFDERGKQEATFIYL